MDTIETIILTSIVNIIITGLVGGIVIYTVQKKIDATIQKSLFEHQTRFARTYPKTLEVLEVLNQKYLDFKEHFSRFVDDSMPPLNKPMIEAELPNELDKSLDARHEFVKYFQANRLYLPEESIEEIEDIFLKTYLLCITAQEYPVITQLLEHALAGINKQLEEVGLQSVKIDREMKDEPFILLIRISEEIDRQAERLEKHYRSVADTTPS